MDELLSEKEQIEALRSWWKENGRYIIAGIVIGVGLLAGWNYWNAQKRQASLEASAQYEALAEAVADNEVADAEAAAAVINDDYGSTVYASQARLAMARLYMDAGRDEDAATELRALLDGGATEETAMVARLRLGKILLYQDKPEEVIELLDGYRDSAFAARYSEALGDAYVALERYEDAAEAYTAALADNPNAPTVDQALVRMKLNDLPRPATEADETDAEASPTAGEEAAETGEGVE